MVQMYVFSDRNTYISIQLHTDESLCNKLYTPYCDYLIRVVFNANFAKTRKMALLNTRNNNVFTTHNASQHQKL